MADGVLARCRKPPLIRSRCTRSIITASTVGRTASRSCERLEPVGRRPEAMPLGMVSAGRRGDAGAELAQADEDGPHDPRVRQVADDGDVPPGEVAEPLLHHVGVEEGLGRVLVHPVPGDVGVDPLADLLGRTARAVPDDERVDAHRGHGERGVAQGLALGGRGTLAGDVDDVRREPLARDLERAARVSSKNRLTTVRPRRVGSFLTSRRYRVHLGRGVEDLADLRGGQVVRRQQVPTRVPAGRRRAGWRSSGLPPLMVTSSSTPSCSLRRTCTRSLLDVGGSCRRGRLGSAGLGGHGRRGRRGAPRGGGRGPRARRAPPDRAPGVEDVVDEHDDLVVDAVGGIWVRIGDRVGCRRRSSRCIVTSSAPTGTGRPSTSMTPTRRWASDAGGMPRTTRSSAPLLRSRISWAIRRRARATSRLPSRIGRCSRLRERMWGVVRKPSRRWTGRRRPRQSQDASASGPPSLPHRTGR